MDITSRLAEMRQYAADASVPILQPECEQILLDVILSKRPKRLLEVGTAIGYSSLLLASAMPKNSQLITLEIDPQRAAIAQKHIREAGFDECVSVILGDAKVSIDSLEGRFDFVFLDGPKGQYLHYLQLMLNKLSPGAVIVTDNVLFRSLVAADTVPRRYRTIVRRLREYLDFITNDHRFSTTLLPHGDGVAISIYCGS